MMNRIQKLSPKFGIKFSHRRFTATKSIPTGGKTFKIVTCVDDPSIAPKIDLIMKTNWPPSFGQDPPPGADLPFKWELLYTYFPQFQFACVDEETNEIGATAHACPNYWDKPYTELPDTGFTWGVSSSQKNYRDGVAPNVLVGTAINVLPEWRNYGLSELCIKTFQRMAQERSFKDVILPIRPVSKFQHQKMSIEEYMKLKDSEGRIYDKWVRFHVDGGATYIKPAAESDHLVGTVAQWEAWLPGEKFPKSGEYYLTNRKYCMIAPLVVDVEKDYCYYKEPGAWARYDV